MAETRGMSRRRTRRRPGRTIQPVEFTATLFPCGFCDETGKDPFGIMSELSTCQVCGGRGTVRVQEPARECACCGGSGVHHNSRLTCLACGGKGRLSIREPVETCPQCGGRGLGTLGLYCLTCKGKGVVTVREEA